MPQNQRLFTLDAFRAGSMNNRIDPVVHELGMMRERRNEIGIAGRWDRRPSWEKINEPSMPWDWAIGMVEYEDSQGDRHVLVVGDDGNIYHDVNWQVPVVMNDTVLWDGTYRASFAPSKNDCFIALGSLDGDRMNLRYDGATGEVFGVSMPGPAAAPTTADDGAGTMAAGAYEYIVVFEHRPAVGTTVRSDVSVASVALTIAVNRNIALTNIPTSTSPGRTVVRLIFRSDDGETFNLVTTLLDNTTVAWVDTNLEAAGETLPTDGYPRIPVHRYVESLPDGRIVWFNDVENDEPYRITLPLSVGYPEAVGEELDSGNASPITGARRVRDGIIVAKRRSMRWLPRQCEVCEGFVEGWGCVSEQTIQNVGSQVAWLSDRGPVRTSHGTASDVTFVGPMSMHSALAETWEGVVKARLPYATSFHDANRALIGWWVQMCPQKDDKPDFNDTIIWWNYAANEVGLWDMVGCCACTVYSETGESQEVWAAYPYGYIGRMMGGQFGDGVGSLIAVEIISVNGQYVVVGTTNLFTGEPIVITGDGWKGSVLHIYAGTGISSCRDISPCDRPNLLIVDHGITSALGRRLRVQDPSGIDATSRAWLGGFGYVVDVDGIDIDIPGSDKNLIALGIQLKGE